MKKPVVFLLVLICCVLVAPQMTQAQCDAQKYSDLALSALPKSYSLAKTYRVDGRGGERKRIEHTLILNSNTEYVVRISSADGDSKGLIATLYDTKHQQLATTYANESFLKGFTYQCPMAGRYFLVFSFDQSENYCGSAVLGFKMP
ncbi:MAG: hypothetical protein ACFCUI_05405 [Bernardetiaceae bacterium]